MIIPIDDTHRITSDRYQWVIQELSSYFDKNKGEQVETWDNLKFYQTIEGAVNGLFQLKLRLAEGQTLLDALDQVEIVAKTMTEALTPYFEVHRKGEIQ